MLLITGLITRGKFRLKYFHEQHIFICVILKQDHNLSMKSFRNRILDLNVKY